MPSILNSISISLLFHMCTIQSGEILRYKRIHSFMMDPKSYLKIIHNHYSLNKQEMIPIDSFINTEYFARVCNHSNTQTW